MGDDVMSAHSLYCFNRDRLHVDDHYLAKHVGRAMIRNEERDPEMGALYDGVTKMGAPVDPTQRARALEFIGVGRGRGRGGGGAGRGRKPSPKKKKKPKAHHQSGGGGGGGDVTVIHHK